MFSFNYQIHDWKNIGGENLSKNKFSNRLCCKVKISFFGNRKTVEKFPEKGQTFPVQYVQVGKIVYIWNLEPVYLHQFFFSILYFSTANASRGSWKAINNTQGP